MGTLEMAAVLVAVAELFGVVLVVVAAAEDVFSPGPAARPLTLAVLVVVLEIMALEVARTDTDMALAEVVAGGPLAAQDYMVAAAVLVAMLYLHLALTLYLTQAQFMGAANGY